MKYFLILFGFAVLLWDANKESDLSHYELWEHYHPRHHDRITLMATIPIGIERATVYGRKKAGTFSLLAVDKSGSKSDLTETVTVRNWK